MPPGATGVRCRHCPSTGPCHSWKWIRRRPWGSGECLSGKLRPLVRVEDFRITTPLHGLFPGGHAKNRIHGVGQASGEHRPAVPIHAHHQIHELLRHWRIQSENHAACAVKPVAIHAVAEKKLYKRLLLVISNHTR